MTVAGAALYERLAKDGERSRVLDALFRQLREAETVLEADRGDAELTDLFRSLGFGDVVVKSHYYRKPRLVERVQTLGLRLIRPLSRMFHADALRVLPGDNLVVGASKGGPVVDEWPRSIFQEPN